MVLLGLPFAFRVERRGSLFGIGVVLVLVLVLVLVWSTGRPTRCSRSRSETILRPYIAAWAPNTLLHSLADLDPQL